MSPQRPKQFHPSGKTRQERRRDFDRTKRPPWHGWYSTDVWKRLRDWHKAQNPRCAKCLEEGYDNITNVVVDHIEPHKGDWSKFLDSDNLQTLCKKHHDQKTVRETGFGR